MHQMVEDTLDPPESSEANQQAGEANGPNKTRITIRLDGEILAWFKQAANQRGGTSYQRLINQALRAYIEQQVAWQEALRAMIREELVQVRLEEAQLTGRDGQQVDSALFQAREPRPYALARDQFQVPSDFDDPLPEDILREFEGL